MFFQVYAPAACLLPIDTSSKSVAVVVKREAGAERRIGTESGMDRARGTGAATRGGPGAGTAARGGPGVGREGGGVRDSPGARPRRPAAPHRSCRYRGAFTRPARWHGASARSRPAQRAITPQQRSQCAGTPQQRSQRAGTPCPRPLRVVSSRLGRLYVSCAARQRSDVSRPPTREGAVLPRRPRAPSTRQAGAQKRPAPRGCGPTKAGCESISRRWK